MAKKHFQICQVSYRYFQRWRHPTVHIRLAFPWYWQARVGSHQQQRLTIYHGRLSDSFSTTWSGSVILTGGQNIIASIAADSSTYFSHYWLTFFRRCALCCTRLWDSDRDLDSVLRVRLTHSFPWLRWQALLFFSSLQYPQHGTMGANTIESWWGNTVYLKTADQQALPMRKVVPGEFFGLVVNFSWASHRTDSGFSGLNRGDVYYHSLCDLCCNFISVFRRLRLQ